MAVPNVLYAPLKEKVFHMCGKAEKAVEIALRGIVEDPQDCMLELRAVEKEINNLHMEIDDGCFKYIALKQPVARDLRFVLACLKANTDLERIGDQAINIGHINCDIKHHPIPLLAEIKTMGLEVRTMLSECLDAFIKMDMELVNSVFQRELEVNKMKKNIFRDMIKETAYEKIDIETKFDVILLSKNLERIGDHAQNIAEHLIFMQEGKDVRHGQIAQREDLHGRS